MSYHEERSTVWKIIAFAVLAIAFWFFKRADSYIAEAQGRVRLVLEAMQKGDNSDAWIQQGVTYYARGTKNVASISDVEAAEKGFRMWRAQKGLDDHKIASYSIESVQVIKDSDPKAAVVEVTIEGKPYAIRTPRGEPLAWDH